VTTSCASSGSATKATFDAQGDAAVSCLAHQHTSPTALYRPGRHEDPYCDRRAPTAIDRQWVDLYVALGAAPAHVSSILVTGGR
jgi:hypothetical protein